MILAWRIRNILISRGAEYSSANVVRETYSFRSWEGIFALRLRFLLAYQSEYVFFSRAPPLFALTLFLPLLPSEGIGRRGIKRK